MKKQKENRKFCGWKKKQSSNRTEDSINCSDHFEADTSNVKHIFIYAKILFKISRKKRNYSLSTETYLVLMERLQLFLIKSCVCVCVAANKRMFTSLSSGTDLVKGKNYYCKFVPFPTTFNVLTNTYIIFKHYLRL